MGGIWSMRGSRAVSPHFLQAKLPKPLDPHNCGLRELDEGRATHDNILTIAQPKLDAGLTRPGFSVVNLLSRTIRGRCEDGVELDIGGVSGRIGPG